MCDVLKKAGSMQVSSAVSNVCVTFIPVKFKDIVNEIYTDNFCDSKAL